jgi:23S rRNA (cytosine1962-C5)-methyltransferase
VVDIFGDVAVVQLLSVGWSIRRDLVATLLRKICPLRAVVLRNDVKSIRKEGLQPEKGCLWGKLSAGEEGLVHSGALKAAILPMTGQKTGAYLDVRHFPASLEGLCRDGRILDGFCFQGGCSLHALRYGARDVLAIDQSQEALDGAERNRVLNGLNQRVTWKRGNVFDVLRELETGGDRFSVAVMDPPPFAPGKASLSSARRGYKDLALRSMKLLEPGGALFFFSCSHAFGRDSLLETLGEASADAGRSVRVVREFHQPLDHPVIPCIPETDYLKGFHLEVDA